MQHLETGTGRTLVRLSWRRWGTDLYVHIGGGEVHVGAAALAGRTAGGKPYAETLCVAPHKEDRLALAAAEKLHAATGVNVCVTAGIHVDKITPAEISEVMQNAAAAVACLERELAEARHSGGSAGSSPPCARDSC